MASGSRTPSCRRVVWPIARGRHRFPLFGGGKEKAEGRNRLTPHTFEPRSDRDDLNGSILLSHFGGAPERTDKFYVRLQEIVILLKERGYRLRRIEELLEGPG